MIFQKYFALILPDQMFMLIFLLLFIIFFAGMPAYRVRSGSKLHIHAESG